MIPTVSGGFPAVLSEAQRAFYNELSVSYIILSPDARIQFLNTAARQWLGFLDTDTGVGKPFSDLLCPSSHLVWTNLLAYLTDHRCPYQTELRLQRNDGSLVDTLTQATMRFDDNGKLSFLLLNCLDITERKREETNLRENQERLKMVLEAGRIGVWDWNIPSGVVHWSGDQTLLRDFTPVAAPDGSQDRPDTYLASLHREDRERIVQLINNALLSGGEYEAEFRVYEPNGSISWVSAKGHVDLEEGEPIRMRGVAMDITRRKDAERTAEEHANRIRDFALRMAMQRDELEKANAKLEALAVTDGLTGLKNHRAFQELLEQEFQRARRHQLPLSLLLLDVDRFKEYNDMFGHPAGDQVLILVAQRLRECGRETDIIARYGGEEFAVILIGADEERARQAAERIRATIAETHNPLRTITVSIGIATLTPECRDRALLIAEADQAMYIAKRGGRNRVAVIRNPSSLSSR